MVYWTVTLTRMIVFHLVKLLSVINKKEDLGVVNDLGEAGHIFLKCLNEKE